MRKIGIFALILIAICALAGCGAAKAQGADRGGEAAEKTETGEEKTGTGAGSGREVILTAPPALTIQIGEESVEAVMGAYSWGYENGDGTRTCAIADSAHPLEEASKKYMPVLSTGEQKTVILRFEALPDEVSAQCWDASCRGDLSAVDRGQEVPVTKTKEGFALTLSNEGIGAWIYEVRAEWKSAESYSGTVDYAFSTESPRQARDCVASEKTADSREVSLCGFGGAFTVTVPGDWECEELPQNEEGDSYSIRMRPEGEQEGYVSISYEPWFGVCGTGLEEKETELAGDRAFIGYYDGRDNWSFITFQGKNEKIVALNQAPDWSEAYREQIMQILDSLRYEPDRI